MKTPDDLRMLVDRIYWQVENGDIDEAVAELQKLQQSGMFFAANLVQDIPDKAWNGLGCIDKWDAAKKINDAAKVLLP